MAEVFRKGTFKKRNVVVVADQAKAGLGGLAGSATADEEGAGLLFQSLDPLGDGRRGNMQLGRGKFEGPAAVNGGEGSKLGGIVH